MQMNLPCPYGLAIRPEKSPDEEHIDYYDAGMDCRHLEILHTRVDED
jgi:hypothetical protein